MPRWGSWWTHHEDVYAGFFKQFHRLYMLLRLIDGNFRCQMRLLLIGLWPTRIDEESVQSEFLEQSDVML